jgi:hypothetical protein
MGNFNATFFYPAHLSRMLLRELTESLPAINVRWIGHDGTLISSPHQQELPLLKALLQQHYSV